MIKTSYHYSFDSRTILVCVLKTQKLKVTKWKLGCGYTSCFEKDFNSATFRNLILRKISDYIKTLRYYILD